MFNLFEIDTPPSIGVILPPNQQYIKTRATLIIQTLESYFSRSSFRLPNNHLLVRILKSVEYSLETPFEKVVETVNARALYIAKHFNLTSELDYGVPHRGVFYSHKNSEAVDYIFAKNVIDVNPFDDNRDWVKESPLKVLYHTATDFNWLLPDGQPKSNPEGYSVVMIDIPLLAFQYREYCLEMIRTFSTEAIYNPNKFLVTRVLPKLYKSHFDHLLINQFLLKSKKIQHVEPLIKLPIALPDIKLSVDMAVNSIYPKLLTSRKSYINTLETLPAIFSKNGLETLKLPSVVPTRQSFWLQLLSRYPHIEFLTTLQGATGRNMNRSFISGFKKEITTFLNTQGYLQFKEPGLEKKFIETSKLLLTY